MSWNPETKIVVAPLNTNIGGDIQKATGVYNNGDIGNTITKAWERGKLNAMAKYRPIGTSKFFLTDADRLSMRYGWEAWATYTPTDMLPNYEFIPSWQDGSLTKYNGGPFSWKLINFTNTRYNLSDFVRWDNGPSTTHGYYADAQQVICCRVGPSAIRTPVVSNTMIPFYVLMRYNAATKSANTNALADALLSDTNGMVVTNNNGPHTVQQLECSITADDMHADGAGEYEDITTPEQLITIDPEHDFVDGGLYLAVAFFTPAETMSGTPTFHGFARCQSPISARYTADTPAMYQCNLNRFYDAHNNIISNPLQQGKTYTCVACAVMAEDPVVFVTIQGTPTYRTQFTLTVESVSTYKYFFNGGATSRQAVNYAYLVESDGSVYMFFTIYNESDSAWTLDASTSPLFKMQATITGTIQYGGSIFPTYEDAEASLQPDGAAVILPDTETVNRTVNLTLASHKPGGSSYLTVPANGQASVFFELTGLFPERSGYTVSQTHLTTEIVQVAQMPLEGSTVTIRPWITFNGTDLGLNGIEHTLIVNYTL